MKGEYRKDNLLGESTVRSGSCDVNTLSATHSTCKHMQAHPPLLHDGRELGGLVATFLSVQPLLLAPVQRLCVRRAQTKCDSCQEG